MCKTCQGKYVRIMYMNKTSMMHTQGLALQIGQTILNVQHVINKRDAQSDIRMTDDTTLLLCMCFTFLSILPGRIRAGSNISTGEQVNHLVIEEDKIS